MSKRHSTPSPASASSSSSSSRPSASAADAAAGPARGTFSGKPGEGAPATDDAVSSTATATAAAAADGAAAQRSRPSAERLARLNAYALEDPTNMHLRAEAFEAAIGCSEWTTARGHLDAGLASGKESGVWRLREGDFWLAQAKFDRARHVLEELSESPGLPAGLADAVLHNLGLIDMHEGFVVDCVARLRTRMAAWRPSTDAAAPAGKALGLLWLRALHHLGELPRAMAWCEAMSEDGNLPASLAGPASLIALDLGDSVVADRWSAHCLALRQRGERPLEALVVRATLALADRNVPLARQCADATLQISPREGRAWSARAFADLLAGDLPGAKRAFGQALATMPRHIGTWHGKAWTEVLLGDLPAAQASFEAALEIDRNFAECQGGMAVVHAMQKRRVEAARHAEAARRLDPQNLSGRYAESLLRGEGQRPNDVLRLARSLLGGRAALGGGAMTDWLKNPADDR